MTFIIETPAFKYVHPREESERPKEAQHSRYCRVHLNGIVNEREVDRAAEHNRSLCISIKLTHNLIITRGGLRRAVESLQCFFNSSQFITITPR